MTTVVLTALGALQVLGLFVALVAVVSGLMRLDDPEPMPWETPGGRNDRRSLLEDEIR